MSQAWLSTSKSEKIAEFFATSGNIEDGWMYVLDTDLFGLNNVIIQPEFKTPSEPQELEVSIAHSSGGNIPEAVVVSKYRVIRKT